jgi:tetratricopeptide (TPR) repeat protein
VTDYAVALGVSYSNLGALVRVSGRVPDALEFYGKAIQILGQVLARDNRLVRVQQFLRDAHANRAEALDKVKRHDESLKDWDRAIQLDQGPSRWQFRLSRALSLARAGDHTKAVSEVNELAQSKDVSGAVMYDLACVCSLASAAVQHAGPNENTESEKLKEKYATRALEFLRQAVAKGYKDVAHIKKDLDLDALRQREDFKKLIAELEKSQEKQ